MTTDRFTKWPHFEHCHISLDREQIHLQQKKKMVIFGSLPGTPPEPPWDPQTSPLTSPDLPRPQKDPPGTPRDHEDHSETSNIANFQKTTRISFKIDGLGPNKSRKCQYLIRPLKKEQFAFYHLSPGGGSAPPRPPHVQLSGQSVSGQLEPACQSVV